MKARKFRYVYLYPNRTTHTVHAATIAEAENRIAARARLLWIDPTHRDRKARILKPKKEI